MKRSSAREKIAASVLAGTLAFFALPVFAQETPEAAENLLHYSYSTIFGTGWYKVGDRRVVVVEAPFSYRIREVSDTAAVGIKLLLPLAIGFNNFDSNELIPDEKDDVSSVSFVPGLELEIPVGDKWLLRPFGQLGFGMNISSSVNATIYAAGLRSRYEFSRVTVDKAGITLGAKIEAAGYSPDNANGEELGVASMGFDVQFPLGLRLGRRWTWLGLSVYGDYYFTEAKFANIVDDPKEIRSDLTIALALGGEPDFQLFGFDFERIGLGYKSGNGIRAITLTTSFPF